MGQHLLQGQQLELDALEQVMSSTPTSTVCPLNCVPAATSAGCAELGCSMVHLVLRLQGARPIAFRPCYHGVTHGSSSDFSARPAFTAY